MKLSCLKKSILLILALPCFAHALDSNIFEKDKEKVSSFSAKVRVVREISDDVEVFFEGDKIKGAYTLPHSLPGYAAALAQLEASKKPGGAAVSISADADKRITEVKGGAAEKAAMTAEDMIKAAQTPPAPPPPKN